MPLTEAAREAFRRQMDETPDSEYLFPSPKLKAQKPYMTNLRKVWANTCGKRVYLQPLTSPFPLGQGVWLQEILGSTRDQQGVASL